MVRLTRGQAARVALAAQGLGRARPAVVGRRAAAGVLTRIGLFQVDSVNVLARAHEMPLFSRCGPYDAGTLDALTTSRNPLAHEAWAHMASLVDVTLEPALRFRQRAAAEEAWGSMRRIAAERPGLVDEVIARLADGPATARQLSGGELGEHPENWGWNWSDTKTALEWAWRCGRVAVAGRTASFEKIYDLPERVLPGTARRLPDLDPAQAHLVLAERAADALGVFTLADLADYFRLRRAPVAVALRELEASGRVRRVEVDGAGTAPWWMSARATVPRRVDAATVVSPFDPLVFHRPRALALHRLDYRIEIYTPAAKRRFGYYALPFLLGQEFVARVDLRARRADGVLEVATAWREPGAEESASFPGWTTVAGALAEHLRQVAAWRGLGDVVVSGTGDLAGSLGSCLHTP